jgi:hypothetical protein
MEVGLLASGNCHFSFRERAVGIKRIGGWVGKSAGLSTLENKQIYFTCQYLKHSPFAVKTVR